VRRRLSGVDDLARLSGDTETGQVPCHDGRRAGRVVGDEGKAHAGRADCCKGLRDALDRVLTDVDDAIEIEQSHVVDLGERLLRCLQGRRHRRHASHDRTLGAVRTIASHDQRIQ